MLAATSRPGALRRIWAQSPHALLGIVLGTVPCIALLGCGGANPMLHRAHTLKQNELAFGSGVTSSFLFASPQTTIDEAQSLAASNTIGTSEEEQTFIEGALLDHSLSPGVSPWVGARIGLGNTYEAGLSYTGQRLRIDGRHAFENETSALSVGAAFSALLFDLSTGNEGFTAASTDDQRLAREGFEFSGTGWGLDVPILFGARVVRHWFEPLVGVRLGYEQVSGGMPLVPLGSGGTGGSSETGLASPGHADATGHRFSAEGIIGLSAGTEPVFLRLELGAAIQQASGAVDFPSISGTPARRDFKETGFSLQPSAALVVEL